MAKATANYDASTIEWLKGLEPVRKNPSMYIGNTDIEGLHHLVYELIDNSVDEHLAKHCNEIKIIINKDGSISVEDDGRGIPVDMHKLEKMSALELVMTQLNAGGKFKKDIYKTSGGLHGIGASAVNALSEWCYVEVRRDGKVYKQSYKRGIRQSDVEEIGKTKHTGTKTVFKPDKEIFKDSLEFEYETISDRIKERAYLNPKLKLSLVDNRTNKSVEFCFEGGIKKFIEELNEKQEKIHDDIIYLEKETDQNSFEIAFQYTRRYSDKILSFANNINTVNGGAHENGFKNAVLKTIQEFIEKNKLFKGLDLNVLPRDVIEGLTAIVSIKVISPQFEGQTKAKLNNIEIRVEIEAFVKEALSEYFKKNEETCSKIIYRIAESIKARDAANKARNLVRRKSGFDALDLPIKLTDCVSKDVNETEVFIVEGDSAAGGAKMTRNKEFQAILSLKGKVLNVEGLTVNKILESEEIKNIISALGIDITKSNYEKDGLRYGKIIIMTDADVDGQHITALLLTLFYRYMRKIIDDGHLYLAKPPLYRILIGNKILYLDSDEELEKMKSRKQNLTIQRFKGLGEMNPDQLFDTTIDVEKRKLEQVTVDDGALAEELFNILMGSDPSLRKQFIMENAKNIEVFI